MDISISCIYYIIAQQLPIFNLDILFKNVFYCLRSRAATVSPRN